MMIFPPKMVYLAGPIGGLSYVHAKYGWRREFNSLMPEHIHCNSPMRGEVDHGIGALCSSVRMSQKGISISKATNSRDFNDVKTCDAMVACFLGSGGRLSGGTMIEYGFAHAFQKPVVAIGPENDINVLHVMAQDIQGWRVDTLEEAASTVSLLLTPGL